ncbi:MAG: hypothetical protein ACM3JD_12490 [Rudaea sp.]
MKREILPGLRMTFLIHFIVGAVFGLGYLLIPDTAFGIFGLPLNDPVVTRMVGAALCGFAASSWWAWHETEWAAVKIIVEMEILWTVLGALVSIYGVLFAAYPPSLWINALLMVLFAIAFGYFYLQETSMVTRPATR